MRELEKLYKQYQEARRANDEDRARKLLEEIEERRNTPREGVNYVLRDRLTFRTGTNEADELRKKVAVYRFCMRYAQKAETLGNREQAERLRAKAADYSREVSMLRRSTRRTIDTPSGDGSLQIRRPGRTGK